MFHVKRRANRTVRRQAAQERLVQWRCVGLIVASDMQGLLGDRAPIWLRCEQLVLDRPLS